MVGSQTGKVRLSIESALSACAREYHSSSVTHQVLHCVSHHFVGLRAFAQHELLDLVKQNKCSRVGFKVSSADGRAKINQSTEAIVCEERFFGAAAQLIAWCHWEQGRRTRHGFFLLKVVVPLLGKGGRPSSCHPSWNLHFPSSLVELLGYSYFLLGFGGGYGREERRQERTARDVAN